MRRLLVIALTGMAGMLASTGLSEAQAPMTMLPTPTTGSQGQPMQLPSPSAVYVPSDIATSSSVGPNVRQPRGRHGGLGLSKSTVATGREPVEGAPNLPRLCFQTGVGWTLIPAAGFIENANPGSNDEFGPGANPRIRNQRGAAAMGRSQESMKCPTMPLLQSSTDDSAEHSDLDFVNPSFRSGTDLSQYDIFQTLLADHPVSGTGVTAGPKSAFDLPEGLSGRKARDSLDPNYALEELKALRHRAYVSPVKLRRLSQHPQNVETRLELRQMNAEVGKRNKPRRKGEEQNTLSAKGNAGGNKHLNPRDLSAKKAECEKKTASSKSKVCSLLKKVK